MKIIKCFRNKLFITFILIFTAYFSGAFVSVCLAKSTDCVRIFDYGTKSIKVLDSNNRKLNINGQDVADYDANNGVLTLNNYKCELLTVTESAISVEPNENETFTIKISGENLIKSDSNFSDEILGVKDCIRIDGAKSGTVLFTGTGQLKIDMAKTEFYTCGIYAYGNLKIESEEMDIASYGCAIHSKSNIDILGNSKLNLKAWSTEDGKYLADGLYADKDLTISDNAKVITEGFDTAMYSSGGNISILDNAVVESNAMAESHLENNPYAVCGILTDNNIFIKGNAKVKAYGLDCGILAGDGPEISKSTITISESAVVEATGKNTFGIAVYGILNILDNAEVYAKTNFSQEEQEYDTCAIQAIEDINIKNNAVVEALGDTYGIAAKNGNINLHGGIIKSFGQGLEGAAFSKKPVILGKKFKIFAGNDENTSALVNELDDHTNSKWIKVNFPQAEPKKQIYIVIFIIIGALLLLGLLAFYIFKKSKSKIQNA